MKVLQLRHAETNTINEYVGIPPGNGSLELACGTAGVGQEGRG